MQLHRGDPSLSGSHCLDGGVNFTVYSETAEAMDLCLFDPEGRQTAQLPFRDRTDHIWHGFLPGASAGLSYGFRAHGPFAPERGLFFDPARLLIDPWARQLRGSYSQHSGHFPGNQMDTAAWTPRSVVTSDSSADARHRHALTQREPAPLIYEAHVRGLTAQHPDVPQSIRGTYAALGHPAIIKHLQQLGVGALELLPVQFHIDEPHLVARGLSNYWGYSPIGCMALHSSYAANPGDATGELASSVARLHEAGIEVILDVVLNHTAEGGIDGPIVSLRGIDPATWYLHRSSPGELADFTGCGNTLNVTHPVVQRWIIAGLRHWAISLGVDGFRFDLALTLGRQGEGFDAGSGLLAAISSDPLLGSLRLIAEPWDVGPHGYRLGAFGTPWREWNDRFRDGVRAYWKGEPGAQAELGRRLHGSSDLFEGSGRTPSASINFITAHDGFCLNDLVSYAHKHNEANGEDNRDGHTHNLSDDCGQEGPVDDMLIIERRGRRVRALLTTLFVAEGTPMLLAGDELGHTQGGNNNAYCQDNATTWLDWSAPQQLTEFVSSLAALRSTRSPVWTNTFVHADYCTGAPVIPSLAWLRADGATMTESDWHAQDCAFVLLRADDQRIELCCFNRSETAIDFRLPDHLASRSWTVRLDSAAVSGIRADRTIGQPFIVEPQSVLILDCAAQGAP